MAIHAQHGHVAQGLQGLEGDEQVGAALIDDGRAEGNLREADLGVDAAAPLAHAVDLGLQRVEAAAAQRFEDDLGEGEDSLAADAA